MLITIFVENKRKIINKENKNILKRIQNSWSVIKKFDEDEKRRENFKKFRQDYMKRLFNASPGFFNKRSPSSCQSHSKMNEYKKLVSSESRFDVCSHSQLPNFSG